MMIMHNDDIITLLSTFITLGMLQSFPLKEISSRDLQSAKSIGLNSGKGNVSNTLTCKLFTKTTKVGFENTNEIIRQLEGTKDLVTSME